ncbi:hypothetical protein ASE85_03225 [Sphingobium sp. Leaf26]|nr:hypothetical protein ASE85_03225 [Sphingobium sp. Leaf26]
MTRALKSRIKSTAKTIGKAAQWLWLLPPIRSVVLTNIARIGLGTTGVAIITAIADAAAR